MNSEEKELQQPKINVFISVPMHDRTKQQIEDELTSHINKVYDFVQRNFNKNCRILESLLDNADALTPIQCLAESIKIMSDADLVVMYPDWQYARGCIIEHSVATLYGKPILYINRG